MAVIVAEHALRHGLTESEILYAWENYVRMQQRPAPSEEYVAAVGCTKSGDMVQMVAVIVEDGDLIIHDMTPPTAKVLKEFGMIR
ncbi:MAG: hypothetical protein IJ131_02835 [Eggerthellaceae bacterium]|nr:hypothetical protein [Eggerthellaceae bacterium]